MFAVKDICGFKGNKESIKMKIKHWCTRGGVYDNGKLCREEKTNISESGIKKEKKLSTTKKPP